MVEIRQNHVASKASSMMLIYWLSASDFFQLCTVDFFFSSSLACLPLQGGRAAARLATGLDAARAQLCLLCTTAAL